MERAISIVLVASVAMVMGSALPTNASAESYTVDCQINRDGKGECDKPQLTDPVPQNPGLTAHEGLMGSGLVGDPESILFTNRTVTVKYRATLAQPPAFQWVRLYARTTREIILMHLICPSGTEILLQRIESLAPGDSKSGVYGSVAPVFGKFTDVKFEADASADTWRVTLDIEIV